jgi:hypothetical protein
MAAPAVRRKFYASFTREAQRFVQRATRQGVALAGLGGSDMAGLAMVMFIALFTFGGQYFGWTDAGGWIQLSLVSSFIFGIICGFRVKD